jgi:hypothetical protein
MAAAAESNTTIAGTANVATIAITIAGATTTIMTAARDSIRTRQTRS